MRESAKTGSKTLAKSAEQTRRRALETGFNNLEDAREERVRTIREIANDYLESYRLRNPRSAIFAEYAVGHVTRILGDKMLVDVTEQTVKHYQDARLRENTAPKSIIVSKQTATPSREKEQNESPLPTLVQQVETRFPQKSLHVLKTEGQKRVSRGSKSLKRFGSSGRIRTYNPSVNSRMLYR